MGVSALAAQRSSWLGEHVPRALRAAVRHRAALVPLLILAPALAWSSKVAAATLLQFAAGCLAFFWLPGLAIARACRLRCRPSELCALTLGLGLAASNLAYVAAAASRQPFAYALLPLFSAAFLYLAQRRRVATSATFRPISPGASAGVVLVVSVVTVVMTMSPVHGVDFVRDAAGTHLVGWPDGTLHTAIANELSHTFPPRNPVLGDRSLAYHYASELSAVVFVKFLGLPATTVCLRLLPTLFVALTVLSFAALVEQVSGSVQAALLTPLLLLLGEDFSYLADWWRGTPGASAGDYFSSPSVFGLYFANPNLPALAAFGCAALGFGRVFRALAEPRHHEAGRRRLAWLGVTAALLGLAGSYKVFFGLQALVALAVLVVLSGRYRWRMAQLFGATLVALLAFQAPWLLSHREEKVIAVVPTFFTNWVPTMISSLGLAAKPWLADATRMFAEKRVSAMGLVQWLGIALPLFVAGTLGVRLLALPYMVRALRAPGTGAPVLPFLAAFVACGYALGLGLRVTPLDYPDGYNNSVWFVVESKLLSSVFVGLAFGSWFRGWSPRSAAWVVALQVLMLAAPGTLSTFAKFAASSAAVVATPDELRSAEYLARHAPPGSVVLSERSNLNRLMLAEARMRVPFAAEFYATSFLRAERLEERKRNLQSFWSDWASGRVRHDLARKYGIQYVVAAQSLPGVAPAFRGGTLSVYRVSELARP